MRRLLKSQTISVVWFIYWVAFHGFGCGHDGMTPWIRLGNDACDECHMIISELKDAAVIRISNGMEYRFDDIGCFLNFLKRFNGSVESAFVYDYFRGDWIRPEEAVFIQSAEFRTPMGYGIIATTARDRVEALKRSGQAIRVETYKGILSLELRSNDGGKT